MDDKEIIDVEITDDVGKFAETYSSFNNIINKLQRQYLSLRETYTKQSEELQSVNRTLQSLVVENRAVTEFLTCILNSLSSGVIAVDKSGRVTHLNPAARTILGVPEDKQCRFGIEYNEIIQPVGKPGCSAPDTVKTGEVFTSVEKKVKTGNGAILTLSVSTSVLHRATGEPVGAVELFHDVSQLKQMEERISRMKVLASLGEMAATVAHEIRNPLVGISGFASLLARDCSDDPAKKDMARKIVEGVNSINQTIQNLLDFARREKVQKTSLNLVPYLNIVLDNFSEQSGCESRGKAIVRDFEKDKTINVEIDRQLFRQALYNLINNGLDAGGDNPWLVIRCDIIPADKAQEKFGKDVELSGSQMIARVEIEDNGPGIPEDELSNIFSPFYSTKENGTGLGLAISWKIIKAHGGDIKVESRKEGGTKFTIVLPAGTDR
jgi:signal transduction histidine kinase